jgi:FkbM family methyltransferase
MTMTLAYWTPGEWLSFWLGSRREIRLQDISLTLRSGNYLAKIADLAMAWEVMIDGVYDTYPIAPTDTVVDIGGHIGSFTCRAATRATQGMVYTCEPFPGTFEVLKKNAAPYGNTRINQIAISNKNGEAEFYFSPTNPAENSLVKASDHVTKVPLMTLGEFFQRNNIQSVDLMKIDCEGSEYDLLYGAGDNLAKVKKMVMEIHEPSYFGLSGKYTIADLIIYLEQKGFQVTFKRENKFQGYIYAYRS